ncbi:DUF2169 domain-containing protein [Sorangium sp. So ce136]|uniref:DUF2169 family type VI secretion system accessory protein n=1 Tax=Sorangium sp. So ce136 TaxID=3133284 RepID=UPI003F0B9031
MLQPWPLSIRSLTPAVCGTTLWRNAGTVWVTVLVKATFELVHGQLAKLSAPLDLVREDRYRVMSGSLEAASELAPYLPGAGVVLTGHAYTPDGRPAASAAARLVVARERVLLEKTVHVFGDRDGSGACAQPFQKMPLIYERAYGGPGIAENPVGVGAAGTAGLPNILDPQHPSRPAGFGPISRHWPARRRLLGSVDERVLQAPEPEIPEAFDWRYFHAASLDQQLERLQGDEWIVLDGLHPTLPHIETRLPSASGKARRHLVTAGGVGPAHTVDLFADTLVIDTERLVCSIVWRGRFALARAEIAPWVLVFAGVELPGQPISWPEPPGASEQEKPPTLPASGAPKLTVPRVPRSHTMTVEHNFRDIVAAVMPFQPVTPPAPHRAPSTLVTTSPLSVNQQQAVLPFMPGESPDGPFEPATTDASRPILGRAPPPITDTGDVNLQAILRAITPFTSEPAAASGAPLTGERRPPPQSERAALLETPLEAPLPLKAATTPPPIAPAAAATGDAPTPEAAAPRALGIRAQVMARLQAGESLQGLALASADLSELDLSGSSLAGLDLRRSNLKRANLSHARAAEIELEGADLTGANAEGADLTNANLTRAVVTEARFDGAILSGANLLRISGSGASFRNSELRGTDLRQARLTQAAFDDAVLCNALAANADLSNCRFHRADLSSVSLRGGKLCEADLSNANLEGADLRDADLTRANAYGASCKTTKMTPAQRNDLAEIAPEQRST